MSPRAFGLSAILSARSPEFLMSNDYLASVGAVARAVYDADGSSAMPLAPWPSRGWRKTRSAALCSLFAVNAANDQHSTYSLRSATIAYPWHPLAGRTLKVSLFRRARNLTCIYTDERPDLSRELPSWMFDASYCSGMTLGSPEISVDGLNKLAAFLVTLRKTRSKDASSRSSKKAEESDAKGKKPNRKPALSGGTSSKSKNSGRNMPGGAGRSSGRSAAGGDERGEIGEEGRRG